MIHLDRPDTEIGNGISSYMFNSNATLNSCYFALYLTAECAHDAFFVSVAVHQPHAALARSVPASFIC